MEENPLHHASARLLPNGAGPGPSLGRAGLERDGSVGSRLASFDALEGGGSVNSGSHAATIKAVIDDIPSSEFGGGKNKEKSLVDKVIEAVLGFDTSYTLDMNKPIHKQMYNWSYIGLYSHYAGVGFTGGMLAMASNFCFYYYSGANNVCANAGSLMALPWGFKIFYGIFTDLWRPFGYRRKLYMILGWMGVLLFTFFLAVASNEIDARAWIGINLVIQAFLMLADVPADGYSVEIGQLEKPEERGQVLATGQRIRFCCVILGGLIQALLVNGPTTNAPGCPIEASSCWAWGFTPNQYYGLMLCILFVLVVPVFFLKEIEVAEDDHGHVHTLEQHRKDIWDTMQNPTTLYLLIFVTGNNVCSGMLATTQSYVQYTLIQLSNFQSGIASILGGGALVAGIMIFQTFFIHRNWRITQYLSNTLVASLSLIWIAVYFNSGGTMNAWFTIVLQCTMSLSGGLAQVLFAMAVIELAKKNQEATTYEFIISVANSSGTLSTIIATQLLAPLHANTCSDPSGSCPSDEVNVSSMDAYKSSGGPSKFTQYSLLIFVINVFGILVFTRFLPRQKDQCREWRDQVYDEAAHSEPIRSIADLPKLANRINAWYVRDRVRVGQTSLGIATAIISYEIISAVALLNPNWSCLPAFGGGGCPAASR